MARSEVTRCRLQVACFSREGTGDPRLSNSVVLCAGSPDEFFRPQASGRRPQATASSIHNSTFPGHSSHFIRHIPPQQWL